MPTLPIVDGYAQAIANASGVASVPLGPQRAGETWHIDSITVQSDSTVLSPFATVYKNSTLKSNVKSSTRQGWNDTDSFANIDLQRGERIWVVWNNCDVGARCFVTVDGTRTSYGTDYAIQ